jgi:hypothetical protein
MSIAVQLLKEQLLGQQLNVHEVAFLTLLQQNAPEEYRLAKEKAEKESDLPASRGRRARPGSAARATNSRQTYENVIQSIRSGPTRSALNGCPARASVLPP